MALSLTIAPAGSVAFVQAGTAQQGFGGGAAVALSAPSTAGTCLIATLGNVSGAAITSAPAGWVLLKTADQGGVAHIEVWAYPNNPGGITNASFTSSSVWWSTQISEYSGVGLAGTLDASGTATATSGTTLIPTTSGNVTTVGCLALAAWVQKVASGTVTFTQPASWVQIPDDGLTDVGAQLHSDGEYQLSPGTGATLGPTLTSSATTLSAAGAIVVLRPATASAEQSAYLQYGSITLKLNTLDFVLLDCPTVIAPLSTVTLSSPGDFPDWVGTISQAKADYIVDGISTHQLQIITATNTQATNLTKAPYKLTDAPATNTNDLYLLENGDTYEMENNAGAYLMESSVQEQAYAKLALGVQVGSTNPISLTTLGELTSYAPALWPGMTFTLVSAALNAFLNASGQYTIQTITITYQGANPVSAVYQIQFGDTPQTLAQWTKAHAT